METTKSAKYYTTSDTALAGYLYYKGMRALEATVRDKDNPRRLKYIFVDEQRREELETEFYRRESEVVPLEYFEAIRDVKRYLNTVVEYPTK